MRRINRCLNPRLIEICKRSVQLEELNAKLRTYLPEALQEHCHAGSFNRGCMVIVASNPVWASQLRYSIPELRDKLRKEAGIYQLTSITIAVSQEKETGVTKRSNTPKLSNQARKAIIASAAHCSFAPLKEALHHLGSIKNKS